MSYKYQFPVGDWSGDGHDKCEWFMVESKKPVQDAREAHFKCPEVLGFEIGDICRDFEDNELPQDIQKTLKEKSIWDAEKECQFPPDEGSAVYRLWPDEIVTLWVAVLNFIDPELELKIIKDNTQSIHFYGKDKKGRHLKTPGYGCFSI